MITYILVIFPSKCNILLTYHHNRHRLIIVDEHSHGNSGLISQNDNWLCVTVYCQDKKQIQKDIVNVEINTQWRSPRSSQLWDTLRPFHLKIFTVISDSWEGLDTYINNKSVRSWHCLPDFPAVKPKIASWHCNDCQQQQYPQSPPSPLV